MLKRILHSKFFPILLLILVVLGFYWKVILKGLIPFPGDLLVGAYYPWLDYKWGYVVGVPIKNPLLSDIFSQFFVWKSLIAEAFRNLQWPLWNPYSYSGYPLLANFNSGALNPFNLLMMFFGDIPGWKMMVIAQSIGSVLAMYFFLKSLKISSLSSCIGAVIYSFSTFAITWSQFVNLGFSMIWLPLILFFINKYKELNKDIYLLLIAPLIFLLMSAGHFQAFLYSIVLINLYFLFVKNKNGDFFVKITKFILIELLSLGLMAVQLIPTYQLMNTSIRFKETYITMYNYGLLPLKHLLAFVSPNYFGNPVTANYWGFFNYHETTMYMGIVGVFSLLWAVINLKNISKTVLFFLLISVISLILLTSNPISQFIYKMNIPFISTSAAGRIVFIFGFAVSTLAGYWSDFVAHINFKKFIKSNWLAILIIISQFTVTFVLKSNSKDIDTVSHLSIAFRNMIPTLFLTVAIVATVLIFKKKILLLPALLLITIADMFYLGWKYDPFVPSSYVFPNTEITNYLSKHIGYGRVESEKGPLLPANTWAYYRIPSISGYDPLALADYVYFYQKNVTNQGTDSLSRYSTLTSNYDANLFGKISVKYLLALKYTDKMEISPTGTNLFYKIDTKDWLKVYEHGSVVILENKRYMDRIRLENNIGTVIGSAKIVKFSPSEVIINFSAPEDSKLIFTNTYTPDWKAQLNSKESRIEKYLDIFMQINVPKGEGTVRFYYYPQTFNLGIMVSEISFSMWIILTATYFILSARAYRKEK